MSGAQQPARMGALGGDPSRLAARLRRLEDAVRSSERDRMGVVVRLLQAERLERRRIAGELHDDTVQVLTAALLSLDRIERLLDAGQARELVGDVRSMLTTATERARLLSFELRPPRLADEGLAAAVADLAEQMARDAGLEVDVRVAPERFGFVAEEIAYRTLQELISNVRKHAGARTATVTAERRGRMLAGSVADDGRGFAVTDALRTARLQMHMGLAAVEERLELAGGSLHVESRPGAGTLVEFRVPLDP